MIGLEPKTDLGISDTDRRVLPRQGRTDLTAQIEAAPPVQRAPLLQQIKDSYGAHYNRALSELEGARLDPTTLALGRRLDDPVAARRLAALQGKTRAALTEGLDPTEANAVAEAARAAVPGPLAPAAERVALDWYRRTGDQDDALALARETVVGEGGDTLTGDDSTDDLAEEITQEDLDDLLATADVSLDPETEAELRRQLRGDESNVFRASARTGTFLRSWHGRRGRGR